jgi:hypothetical protein
MPMVCDTWAIIHVCNVEVSWLEYDRTAGRRIESSDRVAVLRTSRVSDFIKGQVGQDDNNSCLDSLYHWETP